MEQEDIAGEYLRRCQEQEREEEYDSDRLYEEAVDRELEDRK
jgi:hypothetical protein